MSAALVVSAVGVAIRPPCLLVGRPVARPCSRLLPPLSIRPRPRVRCPPLFSDPSPSSSSSSSPPPQADPASEAGEDDSDRLPFEPTKKRRRRRRAKELAPPSPAEQVAQSGDPASVYETRYIQFLSLYFLGLLLDGILISASGFLPEAVGGL